MASLSHTAPRPPPGLVHPPLGLVAPPGMKKALRLRQLWAVVTWVLSRKLDRGIAVGRAAAMRSPFASPVTPTCSVRR